MNKLDIVILNYNTKDLLRDCLNSVASSEHDDQIKTIVVDNNSTDKSAEMVANEFPAVDLIKNNLNSGFSAGNNLAIPHLVGEYTLFLNPDTLVEKNTIKTMIDYMDKNGDVGAATCKVLLPNGDLYYGCHRGFPTPINALWFFSGLSKLFPKIKVLNGYTLSYLPLDTVHEIDSCSGTFLLIRKEIGDNLNWWDEDYYWYGEDLDLCFRIKKAGWKIMYVPLTKIVHIWGAASGIKKESGIISKANRETKIRATNARFDVMKIFYKKHYANRYSPLLTKIVLLAVEVKRRLALKKFNK